MTYLTFDDLGLAMAPPHGARLWRLAAYNLYRALEGAAQKGGGSPKGLSPHYGSDLQRGGAALSCIIGIAGSKKESCPTLKPSGKRACRQDCRRYKSLQMLLDATH